MLMDGELRYKELKDEEQRSYLEKKQINAIKEAQRQ